LGNHFWARGYFVSTVGLDEDLNKALCKISREARKRDRGTAEKIRFLSPLWGPIKATF
jgi:putative transposase